MSTLQLADASERFKALGFEPVTVPNYLAETLAKLSEDERSRVGCYRLTMNSDGRADVLVGILPRELADNCVSGGRDVREAAHEAWAATVVAFFEARPPAEGFRVVMQCPQVEAES